MPSFTEYPYGRTSVPHTSLPSPQNMLHLPGIFIRNIAYTHGAFSHMTHSHSTCPHSIPQQCMGSVAGGGEAPPTHDRCPSTQRQVIVNGVGSEGTANPPLPPPFLSLSVLLKQREEQVVSKTSVHTCFWKHLDAMTKEAGRRRKKLGSWDIGRSTG